MTTTLPPTSKNSHWFPAAELHRGDYFKQSGRWLLATGDVRDNRERRDGFDWAIMAVDTNGWNVSRCLHTRVGVLGIECVEVSEDGTVPGPFRPASLRRAALRLRAKASALEGQAALKTRLANELERRATD